jgi:hypothetical protein
MLDLGGEKRKESWVNTDVKWFRRAVLKGILSERRGRRGKKGNETLYYYTVITIDYPIHQRPIFLCIKFPFSFPSYTKLRPIPPSYIPKQQQLQGQQKKQQNCFLALPKQKKDPITCNIDQRPTGATGNSSSSFSSTFSSPPLSLVAHLVFLPR